MNPIVEIIRLEESFRWGTFGIMKMNKKLLCVTLEPPDIENTRNISSIPAQQYMCWRVTSPKYGETFEVKDVPDRSNILFHAGNFVGDTKGCILLAERFGKLKHNRAVLNSGSTFSMFLKVMDDFNSFHLTINVCY